MRATIICAVLMLTAFSLALLGGALDVRGTIHFPGIVPITALLCLAVFFGVVLSGRRS